MVRSQLKLGGYILTSTPNFKMIRAQTNALDAKMYTCLRKMFFRLPLQDSLSSSSCQCFWEVLSGDQWPTSTRQTSSRKPMRRFSWLSQDTCTCMTFNFPRISRRWLTGKLLRDKPSTCSLTLFYLAVFSILVSNLFNVELGCDND